MSKICHVMPVGVSPCYYVTLYITLERVRYRKKRRLSTTKTFQRQTDRWPQKTNEDLWRMEWRFARKITTG